MTTLQLITNNPYRVLGVYAGCSLAKEASNRSRISAYAKVGRAATFPMRGDDALPELQRTETMASEAAQTLSLPFDRIKHALFWFADCDAPWAISLNNAVDALIKGELVSALSHYEALVQDDYKRNGFVASVTYGISSVGKEELAAILIDSISEEFTVENFTNCGTKLPKVKYLGGIVFEKKIFKEIGVLTKNIHYNNSDFYESIDYFKHMVSHIMPLIKSAEAILGTDDVRYQECAIDAARAIYEQGRRIISCIGSWLWNTNVSISSNKGNRVRHATSRTYLSFQICMNLMQDVTDYVEEAIRELNLDGVSHRIINKSIMEYDEERLKQTDYDSSSLVFAGGKDNPKSWIKTAVWLLILLFIFITI